MLPGQSVPAGPLFQNVVQLGSVAGSVTPDLGRGSAFEMTLTADITLENPDRTRVPPGVTGTFQLILKQNATGGFEADFGSAYALQGDVELDVAPNAVSVIDCRILPDGSIQAALGGEVVAVSVEYAGAGSRQAVAGDLSLTGAPTGSYLAGVMGNVLADNLGNTGGIVAGVVGSYNVTTNNATTNPKGGVVGEVGDLAADADGAVVAVLGGDGGVLVANAAFKAMGMNSTPGSGFDFGLDLTSGAHDGYLALPILKAAIRLDQNVVIMVGAGAPVDGTTGDNFAGPGSLYIDITGANHYIQSSLISTPVWKLVTRAA